MRGRQQRGPRGMAAAAATKEEAAVAREEGARPAGAMAQSAAFRASIDFEGIRENLEAHERNVVERNFKAASPGKVASLYDDFTAKQQEVDALRAEKNANAKAMKQKLTQEERDDLIQKGQAIKASLSSLEESLEAIQEALQVEAQRLPNLAHPDVPRGADDSSAAELASVGEARDFAAEGIEPLDHMALADAWNAMASPAFDAPAGGGLTPAAAALRAPVDFASGAKVSGAKFYYLRGQLARLELALVNWTVDQLCAKGYVPHMTPDVVRSEVVEKCGFQPRGESTQVYNVEAMDLSLTGTAEIPLGGLCMDEVLDEAMLPLRLCAFGRCFRTEAGASGLSTRGLYRVHQFSKVEMFVICTPEQSEALHEELIDVEKELFSALGLHFKVLDMPTGDLGAPAYRKYDVEAWMPGLGRYGEISSASNCTDYQARRLNIRYKPAPAAGDAAPAGDGKKKKKSGGATRFAHTLNGTGCAVPRMIVAILETFQNADGTVTVPEPLRPYMGGLERLG